MESDDFTHDVRLYVNGDFRDEAQNLAYAEWLATQLNSILWLQSQNEASKMIIDTNDIEMKVLRRSIPSIWRNAITNTVHLFDIVISRHKIPSGNKSFTAFKEDLSDMLDKWFSYSRGVHPKSYEDARKVWDRFLEIDKEVREKK